MRKTDDPALRDYDDYIANALRTQGGQRQPLDRAAKTQCVELRPKFNRA
jgi:hypothetical protein